MPATADREVLNFYAGPTALPAPVVEQIHGDLTNFQGTGIGVMEISHRTRGLLGVGRDWEVLFVQGGGSIAEARARGRDVAVVASSADRDYRYVPPASAIRARPGARYLHLVTNNTVEGTQLRRLPRAGVPVVADMSSDLMADVFDGYGCDLAYAHAQKNIGIAGVTMVVVRKSILDYRTHAAHCSNYHTPPVFSIYVTWLMLGWLAGEIGGVAEMGAVNRRKAAALYEFLDETPFYRALAERDSRSAMNVTFTLREPARLKREMGTAGLSNVGSFIAARPSWGVASSFLTCTLTIGGRYQRVYWADGHAEPHATLSVTVTVNHDVVDGAPAARFAETFGRLLERGAGLDDAFLAEATELSGVGHALAG